MKIIKSLFIIISFCSSTQSDAQIFKKLAKKAEKAVERTLEKNVEQKAEKETDKAFDSTFNNSSKKKRKIKDSPIGFGSSKTPESTYRFSHKYTMQMSDGKRSNTLIYYLNHHGDYIGSTTPNTQNVEMINVIDIKNKAMFMFMNNNGSKQLMAVDFDMKNITDEALEDTEYDIKPTGKTKTILGFLAKEYKTKGKDMHGTIWVTEDTDVVFSKAFYNKKSKKGFDKSWMKNMKGLLLEMHMTDTSKRKQKTITLKCTGLEKQTLTIDTSHYKKMM